LVKIDPLSRSGSGILCHGHFQEIDHHAMASTPQMKMGPVFKEKSDTILQFNGTLSL
jgi:hypothetical protein